MERAERKGRGGSDNSWANHNLDLHQSNFLQHLVIFKEKHFIKILEVCAIKCQQAAKMLHKLYLVDKKNTFNAITDNHEKCIHSFPINK